jgi:hypothetical protein
MHAEVSTAASAQNTPTTPVETSTQSPGVVTSGPSPVSPLGFSGLAGLIGLAGGMILQPWLERFYRRMNKKEAEK